MGRIQLLAVFLPAVLAGCSITNYPIITDDRGDYSGIVRTGHQAYIRPGPYGQTAFVYPDGSGELFSMVSQNQYGDQRLYNYNNFDPTASVLFLGQTYCDWKFDDCAVLEAWNPHQNDDPFDYELFEHCSGFRSVELLVSVADRL